MLSIPGVYTARPHDPRRLYPAEFITPPSGTFSNNHLQFMMLFDIRAQCEKILDTFSLVLHLKTPFLKGFLSKILKIFRCAAWRHTPLDPHPPYCHDLSHLADPHPPIVTWRISSPPPPKKNDFALTGVVAIRDFLSPEVPNVVHWDFWTHDIKKSNGITKLTRLLTSYNELLT